MSFKLDAPRSLSVSPSCASFLMCSRGHAPTCLSMKMYRCPPKTKVDGENISVIDACGTAWPWGAAEMPSLRCFG